jgi:catechol 2,3-dioxygenase-like lactoylglutathione lyase family enzyme
VRDQDAALKFFTEKLGFKVTTDQPMSEKQRWIELMIPGADSGLALFTPEGHESRIGEFQSLSFWCDDVFATAKVMKSKGAQFEVEPKKEPWGTTASSRKQTRTNLCCRAGRGAGDCRQTWLADWSRITEFYPW